MVASPFSRDLRAVAEWVPDDTAQGGPVCRDPDDQKFITAAIAARASVLVSGDQDLLVLKRVGEVPVCTPAQALKRWAGVG